MRYVPRAIERELRRAAKGFPAVILTGPRRSGKTTLLRRLFPDVAYRLLEDPDTLERVRSDPRSFLAELGAPAILDEIQNAPELFNYVRSEIDRAPSRRGRFLLTGSQEASLMRGVTESMAGRAAVLHLLPFSVSESSKVSLLAGGFPEAVARPGLRSLWFASYVQTYLERDVRSMTAVRDLATFRRFIGLLASRTGQILNKTDLAAPLGLSIPTITQWLGVLETTGQVVIVPPFFENFGKRLIKSPKVFVADSGLACHLLGIESEHMLRRSPFLGPIFEGFVAAEISKLQAAAGRRRELYYFRDQQGLEVDLLVPAGARGLLLLESKASATLRPAEAEPLLRLSRAIRRHKTRAVVVHRPLKGTPPLSALRAGVSAISVYGLAKLLAPGRG